jgi:hypothetical protein
VPTPIWPLDQNDRGNDVSEAQSIRWLVFHQIYFLNVFSISFLTAVLLFSYGKSTPEPGVIRLVDEFEPSNVEGVSAGPGVEIPPTIWNFNESGSELGWKAGTRVNDLKIQDGRLTGNSVTDFPIVHVERTHGLDDSDLLHAVEVRMRASKGANLSI